MRKLLSSQERLLALCARQARPLRPVRAKDLSSGARARTRPTHLTEGRTEQRFSSDFAMSASQNGSSNVTPSLHPFDFPSPFHHERAKYNSGKGSFKSSAWEVLKHHPDGLSSQDLTSEIDRMGECDSKEESGAEQELSDDIYFFKEDDGKWKLSIYKPLRWGIAGTAQIAEDVVETMQLIPGVEVVAVAAGSSKEKAEGFAEEHGVKKAYGSYDDLAKDPDVDLVYISNLHTQHRDTLETMVAEGKNILCEKPLSVNRRETQAMVDAADKAGVFFMAGLWSRFFPAQKMLKQLIESGELGEILYYEGQIFLQMGEEVSRLYDPEMGGGALLDIGLYMLALGSWVYGGGKPQILHSTALLHKAGVDTTGSLLLKVHIDWRSRLYTDANTTVTIFTSLARLLRYPGKGIANISYSMALNAPIEATVFGTKGTVKVHDRAHNPTKLTLTPAGDGPEVLYDFPQPPKPDTISHGSAEGGWNFGGSMGFVYEVMAVHSAVVNGRKEVCSVSQKEMLELMEITDEVRTQIGVSYPMDPEEQQTKTKETANTS